MINWKRYLLLIGLFVVFGFLSAITAPLIQGVRGALLGLMLALNLLLFYQSCRWAQQRSLDLLLMVLLSLTLALGWLTGVVINFVTAMIPSEPHVRGELFPLPAFHPIETTIVCILHFISFNFIWFMMLQQGRPVRQRYLFLYLFLVFILNFIASEVLFDLPVGLLIAQPAFLGYLIFSCLSWLPFYCACLLTLNKLNPFKPLPLLIADLETRPDYWKDVK